MGHEAAAASLMSSSNPSVRLWAQHQMSGLGAGEVALAGHFGENLLAGIKFAGNAQTVSLYANNPYAGASMQSWAWHEETHLGSSEASFLSNPQTYANASTLMFFGGVGGIVGDGGFGAEALPNFGSRDLLESHFMKHGGEFKGTFSSPDEYLSGAHDVINKGIKVEYSYKGETRTGYVRFAGTSKQKSIVFDIKKPGAAKFEFVGTNNVGSITTFHIEGGKDFWKTINGLSSNKNITPYEYLYPEEEFNTLLRP